MLVLVIFNRILMFYRLKLCLFKLDLLHIVLLNLLKSLIFLLIQLPFIMFNVLVQLLIVLMCLPLNLSILVSSKFFNSNLFFITCIRSFKHLLVLQFTFVFVELYLVIICLLNVLNLKLMHLSLLLLLILMGLFDTSSDLFTFNFCVFPCKFLLLKQA